MARAQATARKPEKTGPILVISKTEDGFQVHSPADPSQMYFVSGDADQPHCTCPAFKFLEDADDPRCEHIDAVFGGRGVASSPESSATDQAGAQPQKNGNGAAVNGKGATMLLKRSVSPDGRIDSLSVEISFPVSRGKVKDLKARAMRTLNLQGEIAAAFLTEARSNRSTDDNGSGDEDDFDADGNGVPDHAEPARMLEIGGINTKWGRRLFIAFQVNGETLKLFGSRKRLADALVAAGRPKLAERIEEGLRINAPCLVTTKENGQYTNVDEVFPSETQPASRGRR